MPFQKGRKKTGGKSKGCKHKINRDIVGLLDSLKCNPIEGLARIATNDKVDISVRVHAYGKLARYVHPELKSVEHTGPGGGAIQHELTDISSGELLESRIAQLRSRRSPEASAGQHDRGAEDSNPN